MTREEERSVIERVLSGDTDAFAAIVLAYQKYVYNLALRMLRNADDALDVSQEVFLRAYSSLCDFRGESRLSVWLYRTTNNLCVDWLRKQKRRAEVSLTTSDADMEEAVLDIPDNRSTPEDVLLRREQRDVLEAGLRALPKEAREILLLRESGGLSYEEIAESLHIGLGTVKSRLARARKKLGKYLSESGNFFESAPSKERKKEV